jgi:hypothetical protein
MRCGQTGDRQMKRAKLGLLEVLGLVENAGWENVSQGVRILLSSLFGANKPLGFAIQTLRHCFLRVDVKLFFVGKFSSFLWRTFCSFSWADIEALLLTSSC